MESNSESNETSKRRQPERSPIVLLKSLLYLTCGVIYGFALHKSYVVKPQILQKQMYFRRVTLITFTLSAIAMSMLVMSAISMLPSTNRLFMLSCNKFYNQLSDKGILSSILGGFLMGIGLTVAGSTPSVLLSQFGAGVSNSEVALIGALTATLLYSLLRSRFSSIFRSIIRESSNPWANSPYFILALPLAAMFGITACGFETLRPYNIDVKVKERLNVTMLSQRLWPAYSSGVLIGLLQVPMFLLLHQTLGVYRGYRAVVSLVSLGRLPMYDTKEPHTGCWWQASCGQSLLLVGIMVGGYSSAYLSGTIGSLGGVDRDHAFWGGFLLLLGANISGGCTSSHGISGMGLLSILSFITMCAVWVGGVATALIMYWEEVYNFIPAVP